MIESCFEALLLNSLTGTIVGSVESVPVWCWCSNGQNERVINITYGSDGGCNLCVGGACVLLLFRLCSR